MCEYTDGCTKRDDPEALALWERRKQADLVVYCPTERRHIIAAVFALPGLGDVLCTPPIEWGGAKTVGGKFSHLHAGLDLLENLIAAGDETEYGRCRRCGTWNFRPSQAAAVLAAHREGRILPRGELVKVRHSNGQVTKMGRARAEAQGLDIVGGVKPDRRLDRPWISGSYVKFDAPPNETSGIDAVE